MKEIPSPDKWLKEAKESENARLCGMFLLHNGTVRETAKAKVRLGDENTREVKGMNFSSAAIAGAYAMPGIYYVRVWLNEGELKTGDDIMFVLVGGDIRPHVVDALQDLVAEIKTNCVIEKEIY